MEFLEAGFEEGPGGGGGFEDGEDFGGGFDFALPAVDGFDGGDEIDAGGELRFDQGRGSLAGFPEVGEGA